MAMLMAMLMAQVLGTRFLSLDACVIAICNQCSRAESQHPHEGCFPFMGTFLLRIW
eukprot:CAMPEP_0174704340 /NCGR_PEP_ID=MMETSP1094-20130205/7974_1 /TAXON_ID=156173 /ORGANISM="Chrysochromulina brevifilum, Strain UTEX LB 985" /LENGTH=55 /DNA_ID=CAMNT_0015902389 /DNA_START=93 /DNA_END=257 /DNA_ORIENTATION=+